MTPPSLAHFHFRGPPPPGSPCPSRDLSPDSAPSLAALGRCGIVLGSGSTFRVRLPLSPVRAEALVHPTAEPADGGEALPWQSLEGVRILLVEDEADAREVLTSLLEGVGAEVAAVSSAREALEHLEASLPDILISDIGMAGMDGYELLRTVRRRRVAEGGRIPAVALTAYARSQDRTQAFAAGFQAHVPKPVDPAELMSAVASLAGNGYGKG